MSGPYGTTNRIIALDIGGTKIAAGVVDVATASVSHSLRAPTEAAMGGGHVARRSAALLGELSHAAPDAAVVAVSLCEIIDGKGVIRSGAAVDWQGLDLPQALQTHLPLHMVSDVRAAALAEARLGAARGHDHALFVSIGTGISSCLIINGVPYAGAHGAALVLASAETVSTCSQCGKVSRFTLESIASGAGLSARYGGEMPVPAAEVVRRAAAGEARAATCVNEAARLLGHAIAQLANALDPEVIVMGGGLGRSAGPYWDALHTSIRAGLWADAPACPAIVQSTLSEDGPVIGAALAAAEGVH